MTDQCRHCVVRGDYAECKKTECGHHYNWVAQQHIQHIHRLESVLTDILEAHELSAVDWPAMRRAKDLLEEGAG